MIRQIILGVLLFFAIACKKEQADVPNNLTDGEDITTTNTNVRSLQRLESKAALDAAASGPAAAAAGAKTGQVNALAAQVPFQPNAGAIWRDPISGKTHLLALQLPGTPGRQVKWASLGTGWEGSTSMAMDRDYFYVAWDHKAVYRIPHRTPNAWTLFIPDNGKYINGIQQATFGIYMVRGNVLYNVNQSGQAFTLPAFPSAISGANILMTGSTGKNVLHFKNYNDDIWAYANYQGTTVWKVLLPFDQEKFFQSMAANPMSKMLYMTEAYSRKEIHQVTESGFRSLFSTQPFNFDAKLVVNNGYVWIMGNTLHQLMTFGAQKGKSAYNELGWEGLLQACADPELVIN